MASTDRLPSRSYVHPYISDPCNADQSPSSRISTLEDLKTLSAVPSTVTLTPAIKSTSEEKTERPSYLWPVSDNHSFSDATKAAFEKKSASGPEDTEKKVEKDSEEEAPVPRFFSAREHALNQLAAIQHNHAASRACPRHNVPAHFSICCNRCDETIPDAHWHCGICDGGDYDLCSACVKKGLLCEKDNHWLIRRFVKDGKVINSTTETMAPIKSTKVEEKKDVPGAFTSDVKSESVDNLERTCNSCVQGMRLNVSILAISLY